MRMGLISGVKQTQQRKRIEIDRATEDVHEASPVGESLSAGSRSPKGYANIRLTVLGLPEKVSVQLRLVLRSHMRCKASTLSGHDPLKERHYIMYVFAGAVTEAAPTATGS